MGLQVGAQIRTVSKGPVAMCTGKGLFTSVRSDVALQQPGPGEGLAAHLADTGQRVAPDVHLESPQAHILLLAVLAAEGFPGLSIAVQLLVLGEPSKGGVGLGALGTAEPLSSSRG